ncbi:MAG: RdgB/HAM1 family non-canonical purine NTP pyrophosphatase [Sedimentisphaerales bacterium]|jgi:XTP/dITP diphosphohydrolase
MRKILVASTNPGKLKELREMLAGDVEWVGLSDFPNVSEIEEDGKTFAENARKKAIGYARATGLWTLADDSGLVVDALNGQPGVKSARFSSVKETNRGLIDHKNMAKVLKLLEGVPKEKRTARFMCCLCLASPPEPEKKSGGRASPEKVLIETSGKLEGLIINEPMGENGFGYDPIFFVPESNKTVAQMTSEEKNAISHRGNAIRSLKHSLEQLL